MLFRYLNAISHIKNKEKMEKNMLFSFSKIRAYIDIE